ncbi:MAG: 4-(cytidine 5'-diphospho)-2-C-methyl-D-erythritol kinase [Tannerella sp.]|jgi:4-diphosphocytidyl-2-C-methyl-D-erythritol kinase|nr:4-(cytidine 5'-diphospho)-2-C-methyl-D-erythritol kinase [Tannerella sp.]
MICFPNAKINLGLHITEKRPDGFHNIETIFYPVPLTDALEAVKAGENSFRQTGLKLNSAAEDNLVMKAYGLISKKHTVPPLEIYLKKVIPPEAGLGGGSADAAFALKLINDLCGLGMPDKKLEKMAAALGADCPFFIRNTPVIAIGTGNIFRPVDISLKNYVIYIVKPPVTVSTKEAYRMITPRKPAFALDKLSSLPVSKWKNVLVNDFEDSVFEKYPIIEEIKGSLYALGAEYASMSGSGSAVFGLFKKTVSVDFPNCFVWKGTLS